MHLKKTEKVFHIFYLSLKEPQHKNEAIFSVVLKLTILQESDHWKMIK